MPPILAVVIGLAGGAVVARWLAKEARRINAELHAEKPEAASDDTQTFERKLRRDRNGVYRPE